MADDARHGSNAVEVTHHFNAKNAKLIALIIVVGFLVYHGLIHVTYGIDSCKWLLSDGRFQGYQVWQPYGCMMHSYTKIDTRMCMRYIAYWGAKNHIVFIGDSRLRYIYYKLVNTIRSKEEKEDEPAHKDLHFSDPDIRWNLDFLWHPMVNTSMYEVFEKWLHEEPKKRPKVIIVGSGTWSIKVFNGSMEAVENYRTNMTRLMPYLDQLGKKSKVLWMLQEPVNEDKLSRNRKMITNDQIKLYNSIAIEVLQYSSVQMWSSARMICLGVIDEMEDGLHAGNVALNYYVQILLNMYCNDHMNYNDGTCCSSPESVTTLQIITFLAFGVCIILAIAVMIHRKCKPRKIQKLGMLDGALSCKAQDPNQNSYHELVTSLARLGLIMAYFYLCDRTNFFMKENKYYTHLTFFIPFAYVFALGLFFSEESQHTQVLHRDQTDETKGWMQLIILIYHMTGASQVLFRMNLLVVVLCLSMNRPYQFYYFVPLVSFWYAVSYVTMVIIPQVTNSSAEANPLQYLYMVLKFVVLFSIVTVLYMSEVFFEKIFVTRPWKALFVTTDDSIKEWWFRWKIDRYSVASGMLLAFAYHLLRQYRIIDDNNHSNLFSRGLSLTATLVSFIGLGIYATFAFLCRNKPECNEIHPYISFVPILSFIVLHNISGLLRTRYSTFFAWFGKISLELFIAQYHIWLAADTHGVLVLVPSYPVLNVIITTFIFVCIAHEVHHITRILVKYAIPNDWRYLVRNVVVFFLILVPIGFHDGMF
ncbi:N-acetylneuraminate (7)9-O-acetyltransferase isoform X2 [Tachypleus tridentatus]|uniref:N-acetylneuraminate (7)9-O-acetyltransferase isoform X2 n=1 Tax=Tachypleus tridentatus TaxID=6853 RepID=UPI003FD4EE97